MSTKITDDTIATYVGLDNAGEVVQYFTDPAEFENRFVSVVSIGYVEAIVTDYDEIYNVTPALEG